MERAKTGNEIRILPVPRGYWICWGSKDKEVTDEGILLRLRDDKLVGITVLNASRFKARA